jgi:ubiquinone/menaquinone biosynthesis C-methylase UbiE
MSLPGLAEATAALVAKGETIFQAYRFAPTDEEHLSRLLEWAALPKNASVIDLGCGIGAVTRHWQQVRPDISVTLVNDCAEQLNYVDHGTKHLCDMIQVPEPDGKFDAAICLFAIGHTSRRLVLREMARLLCCGGILFLFDMARTSGNNDRIERDLYYTIEDREYTERLAKSAGLTLDFYMEPVDRTGYGERLLGALFGYYFDGCKPAIWRFVK